MNFVHPEAWLLSFILLHIYCKCQIDSWRNWYRILIAGRMHIVKRLSYWFFLDKLACLQVSCWDYYFPSQIITYSPFTFRNSVSVSFPSPSRSIRRNSFSAWQKACRNGFLNECLHLRIFEEIEEFQLHKMPANMDLDSYLYLVYFPFPDILLMFRIFMHFWDRGRKLPILDNVWQHLTMFDHVWEYLTIFYNVWQYLTIFDNIEELQPHHLRHLSFAHSSRPSKLFLWGRSHFVFLGQTAASCRHMFFHF